MAGKFKIITPAVFFFLFAGFIKVSAQGNDEQTHFLGVQANSFDSTEKWSHHFQLTSIGQGHQRFYSKYSGSNSLRDSNEVALSLTTTLFLGRKLWKNAAVFFNPEIAGGKGISYALGLAGAANGETFRVGTPEPKLYVARAYFEQHIALGKGNEYRDADDNQLGGFVPASRITISVGKFSIADFFDDNAYSHDPRSEFMNWSLMSNGAWDYPANTRGYTWGAVVELIKPKWAARASWVMVPVKANGNVFDLNVGKAHAETVELERKLKFNNHTGAIKILAFENFSSAPSYSTAINAMRGGDTSLVNIISGKAPGFDYGRMKYGVGFSYWQELSKSLGIFARGSWNNGTSCTWAFTEIDQSVSGGISIKAFAIKREDDVFGLAAVVNGISESHIAYLNAGGYGFMLGDGKLTRYNNEMIMETFYKIKFASSLWATLDYQLVFNPGYNADRGPVSIFGLRVHVEY
jgi:high affinity Mn2+ porin